MKIDEDKEQITNPVVNIVFVFNLQTNNNCSSAGFGMQRSKDDVSGISIKSKIVFTR
jgi:hypothetical protein